MYGDPFRPKSTPQKRALREQLEGIAIAKYLELTGIKASVSTMWIPQYADKALQDAIKDLKAALRSGSMGISYAETAEAAKPDFDRARQQIDRIYVS